MRRRRVVEARGAVCFSPAHSRARAAVAVTAVYSPHGPGIAGNARCASASQSATSRNTHRSVYAATALYQLVSRSLARPAAASDAQLRCRFAGTPGLE